MSDQTQDPYTIGEMFRVPTHDPTGMSPEDEKATPEEQLIGIHIPFKMLKERLTACSTDAELRAYARLTEQQSLIDSLLERVDSMVTGRAICQLAGSVLFDLGHMVFTAYGDVSSRYLSIRPANLEDAIEQYTAAMDVDSRLAPMMAREQTAKEWGEQLELELSRMAISTLCGVAGAKHDIPAVADDESRFRVGVTVLECVQSRSLSTKGDVVIVAGDEAVKALGLVEDEDVTPTPGVSYVGSLQTYGGAKVWLDPYMRRNDVLIGVKPWDASQPAFKGEFRSLFVREMEDAEGEHDEERFKMSFDFEVIDPQAFIYLEGPR